MLRNGRVERIATTDIVPGDVLVLGEGDTVPADGRLFAAASLRIAEASLTGESVPVSKKPETLEKAKALGDRSNMVFNGTSVTQGTGRAIVTGTGMNTQVGKIADLLQSTEDDTTPLQKEMNHVSKILGIAVCIIAAVVLLALAVLEGFHSVHDVIDSLLLAVSLAVAAVPESTGDHSHRRAGSRRAAHGCAPCHCEEAAFGGDAGFRIRHLLRQDRYAHA